MSIKDHATRILFVLIALFITGFITRFPTIYLTHIYALHGVLAAPFYAAIAYVNFEKKGHLGHLVAATLILAAILSKMSPVMGLSFALLSIITLIVGCVMNLMGASTQTTTLILSITYGTLNYFCTLATGVLKQTFFFTPDIYLSLTLFAVLSCLLSVVGVVVARSLLGSLRRRV